MFNLYSHVKNFYYDYHLFKLINFIDFLIMFFLFYKDFIFYCQL